MPRLELYDGKYTKYSGLWYHPDIHAFTSTVFSMNSLRQFKGNVRLKVVKNRHFNGGENGRPNYLFSIMDSKKIDAEELRVMEDDDNDIEEESAYWYTASRDASMTEQFKVYCCSECDFPLYGVEPDDIHRFKFCPGCGLPMRDHIP